MKENVKQNKKHQQVDSEDRINGQEEKRADQYQTSINAPIREIKQQSGIK